MRDSHDGLPEILDAYEIDGSHFGVVQVQVDGRPCAFEFGVELGSFRALRRILQERPFETIAADTYRYFFVFVPDVPIAGDQEPEKAKLHIRIEQGHRGRQFHFVGPRALFANLSWFFQLEDLKSAAHLKQVEPRKRG